MCMNTFVVAVSLLTKILSEANVTPTSASSGRAGFGGRARTATCSCIVWYPTGVAPSPLTHTAVVKFSHDGCSIEVKCNGELVKQNGSDKCNYRHPVAAQLPITALF